MSGRPTGWLATGLAMLAAAVAGSAFASDGGPAPDAGALAAGASITVVLTDRAGKPVPGAEVFVEAVAPGGARRRMEMKTDARGEARVLGVPTELERVVAGFRGAEGLLVTSPVELASGPEARVVLTVPEATESRGDLSIDMLHVVLEREGGRIEVSEVLSLRSAPGTSYRGAPLRFPLPDGAVAPMVPTRDEEAPAATLEDDAFVVRGPIPAGGLDVELRFELPIDDGRIAFSQRFGLPIRTVRAVCTWTADGAALRASGLRPAETTELMSGLAALVAMGPGPGDGRLELRVTGLRDGPAAVLRVVALAACLALVALGAILRLRRRRSAGAKGRP
jgi:hypothetical protein